MYTVGKWERFDDSGESLSKKLTSAAASSTEESGAVCAADALVSDSRWTALDDSHHLNDDEERSWDDGNLPFRKVQSMRATTNRKIQIVDALRQRRLSNSSLDREPGKSLSQFKNEDELTRKFKVERDWQVYVKMDKRVPGTKYVIVVMHLDECTHVYIVVMHLDECTHVYTLYSTCVCPVYLVKLVQAVSVCTCTSSLYNAQKEKVVGTNYSTVYPI